MAAFSSILAWRIPGTEEPGGLPSIGSYRVGHDWSDLAAAAAASNKMSSVFGLKGNFVQLRTHFSINSSGNQELTSICWEKPVLIFLLMSMSYIPYIFHYVIQISAQMSSLQTCCIGPITLSIWERQHSLSIIILMLFFFLVFSMILYWAFLWLSVKESASNAGDLGSVSGSGRSPGGGGHDNPLHGCSCLENFMGRGAWWAIVHGVVKSWTWLSDTHSLMMLYCILIFLSSLGDCDLHEGRNLV